MESQPPSRARCVPITPFCRDQVYLATTHRPPRGCRGWRFTAHLDDNTHPRSMYIQCIVRRFSTCNNTTIIFIVFDERPKTSIDSTPFVHDVGAHWLRDARPASGSWYIDSRNFSPADRQKRHLSSSAGEHPGLRA